ncbi:Polyubiquitin [Hordeum vulgare]|nr:Polyubiquitin [Hordeum vulgare]
MASIKINLVVDRSRNHVLFADTGFDFVDVLLTFLTLPLSTIQSCSAGATSPGCLSNLCDSVDRLRDSRLLKVEACHGMLLTPAHADEFKLSKSANSSCNEVLIKGSKCCVLMARLLNVYNQAGSTETFVSRKERFVIGDGMTIKLASTSSLQSLPQTFGSDGIAHGFEEVQVSVSWETVSSGSVLQICSNQGLIPSAISG